MKKNKKDKKEINKQKLSPAEKKIREIFKTAKFGIRLNNQLAKYGIGIEHCLEKYMTKKQK